MPQTFDVVVVGGGLVGTSTAFHLAARSELTVALVERGKICSGGTASSCAIVRTHYSVPGNVALTVESLRIFDDFPAYLEDPEAESGFIRSGYLILAPEGQTSDKLVANMRMQQEFAETRAISHADALELHPLLNLAGIDAVGYEPHSGYADPYLTTAGFERAARRCGVTVMTGQPVDRLLTEGMRVADMVWRGLPLQGRQFGTGDVLFNDGAGYFRDESFGAAVPGSIYGRLYGPGHEEVGGLFQRDGVAGAFAGKRDR